MLLSIVSLQNWLSWPSDAGFIPFVHCALKLENELFPTVVVVDIQFPTDRREMFSEQIPTAAESVLNNSLRSWENGCPLQQP